MTPCIAIVGKSGSGKTTLIAQLIQILSGRGYRVGAIKHAHHDVEIDRPGKDSFVLKAAGAARVGLLSLKQWALISDLAREPSLEELVATYFDDLDLVLAEGFKNSNVPKIVLQRGEHIETADGIVTGTPSAEELADLLEERFLKWRL